MGNRKASRQRLVEQLVIALPRFGRLFILLFCVSQLCTLHGHASEDVPITLERYAGWEVSASVCKGGERQVTVKATGSRLKTLKTAEAKVSWPTGCNIEHQADGWQFTSTQREDGFVRIKTRRVRLAPAETAVVVESSGGFEHVNYRVQVVGISMNRVALIWEQGPLLRTVSRMTVKPESKFDILFYEAMTLLGDDPDLTDGYEGKRLLWNERSHTLSAEDTAIFHINLGLYSDAAIARAAQRTLSNSCRSFPQPVLMTVQGNAAKLKSFNDTFSVGVFFLWRKDAENALIRLRQCKLDMEPTLRQLDSRSD
jgi:hypothetical protein